MASLHFLMRRFHLAQFGAVPPAEEATVLIMSFSLSSDPRFDNTFWRVLLKNVLRLPSVDIHSASAERAFMPDGTVFEATGE